MARIFFPAIIISSIFFTAPSFCQSFSEDNYMPENYIPDNYVCLKAEIDGKPEKDFVTMIVIEPKTFKITDQWNHVEVLKNSNGFIAFGDKKTVIKQNFGRLEFVYEEFDKEVNSENVGSLVSKFRLVASSCKYTNTL